MVEMLVYFPEHRFLRHEIDEAGIRILEVPKAQTSSWAVMLRIRELFRDGRYDAVISFLGTPSFFCEVAKVLAFRRTTLIVSERGSAGGDRGVLRPTLFRLMHLVANAVVANSHRHAAWLRRHPWLKAKTHVIYNGYPLVPLGSQHQRVTSGKQWRFLIVGRVHPVKNGVRVIRALVLHLHRHGHAPFVAWAGRQEADSASRQMRQDMEDMLTAHPEVAANWQWLGERQDIPKLLVKYDALLHVSLHEGLPNAICEAFIAARPVIASSVSDHSRLVDDGVRGFLCDPLCPESICCGIERFTAMKEEERSAMGERARAYAEHYLTLERMVGAYECLAEPLNRRMDSNGDAASRLPSLG